MTPEAHASCPAAVAVLRPWQDQPDYWCSDPGQHRTRRSPVIHLGGQGAGPAILPGEAGGSAGPGPDPDHNPARQLVIEGNRAWVSAGTARQLWLAELLSRKTLPARSTTLIARFVASQLLAMPQPLRQALPGIHSRDIYAGLGGPAADAAESATMTRLWLLALAPVAAAYEDQITGDGDQRATWRFDRYAPCPHADAGAWLGFCEQLGHQLSPIEKAVTDGLPYRGDNPDQASLDGQDDQQGSEPGDSPGSGAVEEPEPGGEQPSDAELCDDAEALAA